MLVQFLAIGAVVPLFKTAAVVIIGAVCVVGYFLHKGKIRKKEEAEQQAKRKSEAIRKDQEERRKALVDRYCKICRNLDDYRDWDAYCKSFLEIGPFLQLLLGSERSRRIYGTSDEKLLKSLMRAVNNFSVEERISKNGVLVDTVPSKYNEARIRSSCEKIDISRIEEQLKKNELKLAQYRRYVDCKGILNACGTCLYKTVCSIVGNNVEETFRNIQELAAILENSGCYAIFADDIRVEHSESMRIDFREDGASATELPGFYVKYEDGEYCRIGNLGGTIRRI